MRTRIIGTDTLLMMAKQLKDSGEISNEQYQAMQERNEKLSSIMREDIVTDEVNEVGRRSHSNN